MDNVEFIENEEEIRNTNSRALKNKESSYRSIRTRYYEWRLNRIDKKIEDRKEELKKYQEQKKIDSQDKGMIGKWADGRLVAMHNRLWEDKLKKLDYKKAKLSKRKAGGVLYRKFNKVLRVLGLSGEQLNELRSISHYSENLDAKYEEKEDVNETVVQDVKSEEKLDQVQSDLGDNVIDMNNPTEFKVDSDSTTLEQDEVNEKFENDLRKAAEKDLEDEVKENDTDDIVQDYVNDKIDVIDMDKEEKDIVVTAEEVESEIGGETEKKDEVIVTPDIESERIKEEPKVMAEEDNKDMVISEESDRINAFMDVYRQEHGPQAATDFERKFDKFNELTDAMTGKEADEYFEKNEDPEYKLEKKINEIIESTELSFVEKKEAIAQVKKELEEAKKAKEEEYKQRQMDKEKLENDYLKSMFSDVKEIQKDTNELNMMFEQQEQEIVSLQQDYDSNKTM